MLLHNKTCSSYQLGLPFHSRQQNIPFFTVPWPIPALEVILERVFPTDVSAIVKQPAASKRGKIFICTLPRTCLNKLKINAFYFPGYRELKEVFSHIFIIAYNPLFCQRPANCLLPPVTVTVSGTKILCGVMIHILHVFKWVIIKTCLLTHNHWFSVSISTPLW